MTNRRTHTADVTVIGAGLHGCSAAVHLARRGLSVVVIEKDYAGRHASGVNAGGVRRLGRALPEVPLAVASAAMWSEIEELVGDDCRFESASQIKVAENETDLTRLVERAESVRRLGYDHERIIDRESLRELLPMVAPHCVGGMIVEGDGHALPFHTVQAFKARARELGVRIHEGLSVTGLDRHAATWTVSTTGESFQSPFVLNCAGAWGGRVAAMVGESIPVEARAPMLMITAPMPRFVTPVVGAQGQSLSFKQFPNGTVLIGGGHEGTARPESNETHLDYRGLARNAQTAVSIFPCMTQARVVRCWAGIEGMMPDRIPVIGPSTVDGLFHAFGFSAHGFQLGPVGGRILSDLVVDGSTDLPIEPFRIDRFQAVRPGTPAAVREGA